MLDFDRELDATGLECPLPVLETKKVLKDMEIGRVLRVICTDPMAPADFIAFTRTTGHLLLGTESEPGKYIFYVQRN